MTFDERCQLEIAEMLIKQGKATPAIVVIRDLLRQRSGAR